MQKNIVTVCLIIFVVAVIGILGASVLNQNKPAANQQIVSTNLTTKLTLADVAKHSTAGDCWVIVDNNAYDVTSIIPGHPGGASAITSLCGKDATTAFETKGGRGAHSQKAQDVLAQHLVVVIQ